MERQGHDEGILRYERMVEEALRGVVREAITRVGQLGLPAGHSLYITFKTKHPGVDMADVLRAQHPETMTIVIEHQYWDLAAEGECLAVTLSFKGRRQRLTVPFAAITAFHDPGAQFGLRFDQGADGDPSQPKPVEPTAPATVNPPIAAPTPGPKALRPAPASADHASKSETPPRTGEVVSLEAFRKK